MPIQNDDHIFKQIDFKWWRCYNILIARETRYPNIRCYEIYEISNFLHFSGHFLRNIIAFKCDCCFQIARHLWWSLQNTIWLRIFKLTVNSSDESQFDNHKLSNTPTHICYGQQRISLNIKPKDKVICRLAGQVSAGLRKHKKHTPK